MSLDNCGVIDAIGTGNGSYAVVLSIVDSWDWDDEKKHLVALQAKLNAYFQFVESGQIYEAYPSALGKMLCIDIICRYPIPQAGLTFLEKASARVGRNNQRALRRMSIFVSQPIFCSAS